MIRVDHRQYVRACVGSDHYDGRHVGICGLRQSLRPGCRRGSGRRCASAKGAKPRQRRSRHLCLNAAEVPLVLGGVPVHLFLGRYSVFHDFSSAVVAYWISPLRRLSRTRRLHHRECIERRFHHRDRPRCRSVDLGVEGQTHLNRFRARPFLYEFENSTGSQVAIALTSPFGILKLRPIAHRRQKRSRSASFLRHVWTSYWWS